MAWATASGNLAGWAVAIGIIAVFFIQSLTQTPPPSTAVFTRVQAPIIIGLLIILPGLISAWLLRRDPVPAPHAAAKGGKLARAADALFHTILDPLMDIVQRTEDAYWDLIARQDERRVAEKSLETARALLDQTQAQFEVGVVSRVEVVQAEAGVADREFSLIRAQAQERNSQDALIDVVLGPYLEPESDVVVEAVDRPDVVTVREVSTTAATERAMSSRLGRRPRPTVRAPQALASACSRSAIRSSGSSMPTDRRT